MGAANEEQDGFEYGAIYESRSPPGPDDGSVWTRAWAPEQLGALSFVAGVNGNCRDAHWKPASQPNIGEEVAVPREDDYTYAVREAVAGAGARFAAVGPVVSAEHENAGEGSAEVDSGVRRRFTRSASHRGLGQSPNASSCGPAMGRGRAILSLYEYVGSGNREPVLVGVKNTGPLEGETPSQRTRGTGERMRDCLGVARRRQHLQRGFGKRRGRVLHRATRGRLFRQPAGRR